MPRRLPWGLVLFAACAEPKHPAPRANDVLIVGYDREPDTLNRFSTHILEDTMICISEGLTVWNEKMEAVPVLAEVIPSPENGLARVLEDGRLEVTWKLRPGIRWHDGEPFDSRDVAFTVQTINDPGYNPESTEGFDLIESVETPDELTAVVTYQRIYAAYQDQFWRGALPRHVLEGKDLNAFPEYDRKPDRDRSLQGGGMENGGVPPPHAKRRLLAGSAQDRKNPLPLPRFQQHAHESAARG